MDIILKNLVRIFDQYDGDEELTEFLLELKYLAKNKDSNLEDNYPDITSNLKVNGYTLSPEDSYGGEGLGEEYWVVFRLEFGDINKFVKIPGYYASHYGAELNYRYMYEVEKIPIESYEWREKK